MDKQQVDRLPGEMHLLTVTTTATEEIQRLARDKPQGAFRVRADILALKTDFYFEWDDVFGKEDYIITTTNTDIVMDATTIAYLLDEYTLDYTAPRFLLYKNPKGPRRHQGP
jgi:Fe-S cluster assembly iron-binding protein IscA